VGLRLAFGPMTANSENRIRILIADDHELMRHGLRSMLSTRPDWEVCGEAVNGREAIEKTRLLRPDILLLDITMPNMSGLDVARAVSREIPATQVLILSQHEESDMRPHALEAGARGYVSKSEAARQLLTAIESLVTRKVHASQST
jgi:DNA-binding NarL/FixJ family response regulator